MKTSYVGSASPEMGTTSAGGQGTMAQTDAQLKEVSEIAGDWLQQLEVLDRYLSALAYVNVATLGPAGTSSEIAAGHFISSFCPNKEAKYSLYNTYEQAFESVCARKDNVLIVANAYQHIDKLYMSLEINLLYSFIYDTPLYGLAKSRQNEIPTTRPVRIGTHHAPAHLIPWFLFGLDIMDYEIVPACSTSHAAIAARDGEIDICVTNMTSVERYGLHMISRTRPIRMLWSVFGA
jgi:hypothetical protein